MPLNHDMRGSCAVTDDRSTVGRRGTRHKEVTMSLELLTRVLEVVVGLGLLNVWLLRSRSATSYRGGDAKTLRQAFAAYGLPVSAFYVVGSLKVAAGLILLSALFLPMPARLAATVVAGLMVGALAMHIKVKDPASKSVPAALMLAMCVGIVVLL
jgi:DoxX-like family